MGALCVRQVTLKFMDYDFAARDDPLGELHVPLEPLRTSNRHAFENWPLPTQGTATFIVQWIPEGTGTAGGSRMSVIGKGASLIRGPSSFMRSTSSRMSSAIRADAVSVTVDEAIAEEASFNKSTSSGFAPPASGSLYSSATFRAAAGGSPAPISAGATANQLGKELDAFARVSARGKLTVELASAKNLIAADSNGKSDPYCKVSTRANDGGKVDVVTRKSKTVPKDLNPEWNEA